MIHRGNLKVTFAAWDPASTAVSVFSGASPQVRAQRGLCRIAVIFEETAHEHEW